MMRAPHFYPDYRVNQGVFVFRLLVSFIAIAFSLLGCASEMVRTQTRMNETDSSQQRRVITFVDNVVIKLSSGYSREIAKDSKWLLVGTTKEGNIFKPTDTVFTIEGAHVREAYLAISNNRLIGFYIPGENSFSPLGSSILLPIRAED